MFFVASCSDDNLHSICDVDRLPTDQSYNFARVAIYSDGHTTLAFDYDAPDCEAVAFASSPNDIQSIWEVTSQSTTHSTIGAVGNVAAKLEKNGPDAVQLKFIGVDRWEARKIDAQIRALHARMPGPKTSLR